MTPAWMTQAAAQAAEQAPIQTRPTPATVPGRVMHLDGDLLCYWAGGNEDTTVAESRLRAAGRIETMREASGSESVVVHLTHEASSKGDRRIIATVKGYQTQRKSSRKPKNWAYLREWLAGTEQWTIKMWTGREADDGIALCAHHAVRKGLQPIVIASGDKDMRMLPGIHCDWQTFDLTEVPPGAFEVIGSNGKVYGTKWFWLQMIQGDTADNIPGLERYKGKAIGEVGAAKALAYVADDAEAWSEVASMYAEEYGDDYKDRFVEQAMLLWLRTDQAAWCGDFWSINKGRLDAPWPGWLAAINRVQERIKEAYAEAESLGGVSLPGDATL